MRTTGLAALTLLLVACVEPDPAPEPNVETSSEALSSAARRGHDVWFNNTYGGEKFFLFLKNHPDPAKRIDIGFHNVIETPRDIRFDVWGVINDPDCHANPAGGPDICPDPEASGVIGIRKKAGPGGTTIYGTACASCHAGFDPNHPPADPNEPTWANINPTIANQYLRFGDIFSANLAATDPRKILFDAWPVGSVDTTLLFTDGIDNPGVVTHFWEWPHRPTFDVDMDTPQLRNGQGGEDDVGPGLAALRVYTNIGVCFQECVAPAVVTSQPISIAQCRASCPDFPPQTDLDDLGTFLRTAKAPKFPGIPVGPLMARGKTVFDANCAGCHDRSGDRKNILTNDEVNPFVDDPINTTNKCRALTSNWETGKLWAEFSSQVYKDRIAAGDRGYRTMPLTGIWATSPLLHNQAIGYAPPPEAWSWERSAYFWDAMWELMSDDRTPVIQTLPVAVGPFPAGTPLQYVFSRSPSGALLCDDVVENHGHYYGADLPVFDKISLIHWLQFQ